MDFADNTSAMRGTHSCSLLADLKLLCVVISRVLTSYFLDFMILDGYFCALYV